MNQCIQNVSLASCYNRACCNQALYDIRGTGHRTQDLCSFCCKSQAEHRTGYNVQMAGDVYDRSSIYIADRTAHRDT